MRILIYYLKINIIKIGGIDLKNNKKKSKKTGKNILNIFLISALTIIIFLGTTFIPYISIAYNSYKKRI